MKLSSTLGFAAAAVVPPAAVATALVTQHVFGMQPCPWCVLQRLIFLAIAVVALAGLLLRQRSARRALAVLIALRAAGGTTAALWQHFVAAKSVSCNLTVADRIVAATGLDGVLPEVFAAYASCADAAATLLGVPYEFYSLTLFVALGATAVWLLRRTAD